MDLETLIKKTRTYRRFDEEKRIPLKELKELVSRARCTASGANLQPLKYYLSADSETNGKIYPHLKWAAYLKDWDGPEEGERPVAYMIILRDKEIKDIASRTDAGIQIQTILLSATEKGFSGCIFASVDKDTVMENLNIDKDRYEFLYLLAFGYPHEEVVLEDLGPEGDIKYYRDEKGVHHVPKRTLDELIIS
ncbi:MAG: nitroreductase family protein [Spirochaetaceae bacterium]